MKKHTSVLRSKLLISITAGLITFSLLHTKQSLELITSVVSHRSLQLVHTHPKFRHAVIHVGPPKTATTYLQHAMSRDIKIFASDKYYVIGPFPEFVWCVKDNERDNKRCNTEARLRLQTKLADAVTSYDHLFISSEGLGDDSIDFTKLKLTLRPWQDVKIAITYRRLFIWLASKYNQYQKTLKRPVNRGGGLYPSIAEWLTPEKIIYYYDKSYVPSLYNIYKEHFETVEVINIIEPDDVVTEFYCNVIPEAKNACQSAQNNVDKETWELNHSIILDYDRLTRAAFKVGLVNDDMPASFVSNEVRLRQEVVLGKTNKDFPQECMTKDALDLALELSLETEKKFFPEWFASEKGEDDLRRQFVEAATTTLCSADVMAILEDEGWQSFFKNMKYTEYSGGESATNAKNKY